MSYRERRAWPRFHKPYRVLILDPEDGLQEPYVGWVVDRSEGGLCVVFKRVGLKIGDTFLIELDADSENEPWTAVAVKTVAGGITGSNSVVNSFRTTFTPPKSFDNRS
jgi:hypothetical protein